MRKYKVNKDLIVYAINNDTVVRTAFIDVTFKLTEGKQSANGLIIVTYYRCGCTEPGTPFYLNASYRLKKYDELSLHVLMQIGVAMQYGS